MPIPVLPVPVSPPRLAGRVLNAAARHDPSDLSSETAGYHADPDSSPLVRAAAPIGEASEPGSSSGSGSEVPQEQPGAMELLAAKVPIALSQDSSQAAADRLLWRTRKKNPMASCAQGASQPKAQRPAKRSLASVLQAYVLQTLPVLSWLPQYKRSYFLRDLIAGLTVGVMAIPQSMSYASIAGLPYVNGMYTACVPPLIYALFGTSRHLVVGPVAMESLLIATGLAGLLTPEECPKWYALGGSASGKQQSQLCPAEYTNLVITLCVVVGILETLAYFFQLGVFLRFLGQPVAHGFTAGSALLIIFSQLKDLLGVDTPNTETIQETVENLAHQIRHTNGWPLLFGLLWLGYLLLHKFGTARWQRLKFLAPLGPLICCIAGGILLASWPELRTLKKVKIIGQIPKGLPPVSTAAWAMSWSSIRRVLPTAVSAWIVGDMEAIAIGRGLAAKSGYVINNTQEMLAQGVSNLVGGLFSCYPATGSFSRSAVNHSTGAQTQLAAFISGIVLLLTLGFLTPVFYYVPKFALAAIVITSVITLIDIPHALRMYRVVKRDFFVWLVTALAVLFLGILWGIVAGVGLSLLIILFESAMPQISVLWRLPGTTIYRNIKQESGGLFIPNVFICRLGASIYFANASHVRERLLTFMHDLEGLNRTEYVVMEMTSVVFIDYTGAKALQELVADLRSRGLQIAFAMVGNRLEKAMRRSGLTDFIGEKWFFATVDDAVCYCLHHRQTKLKDEDLRGEAQPADIEQAVGDTDVSTAQEVRVGDELGVSNCLDGMSTAVFLSLTLTPSPRLHRELAEAFENHGANVVRAQIEPLPHGGSAQRYFLQRSSTGGKLDNGELESLRETLAEVVRRGSQAQLRTVTESHRDVEVAV